MIRYPSDIMKETQEAAFRFLDETGDEILLSMSQEEIAKATNEYVYAHVSDRAKAFLDDVRAIRAYADKHGLMV